MHWDVTFLLVVAMTMVGVLVVCWVTGYMSRFVSMLDTQSTCCLTIVHLSEESVRRVVTAS